MPARGSRLLLLPILGIVTVLLIGGMAVGKGADPSLADATAAASAAAHPVAADAGGSVGASATGASARPPARSPVPSSSPVPTPFLPRNPNGDGATTSGPPAASDLMGYQWPLIHGRLTLPFGPTPWGSRIVDGQLFHDGVDLATFCGDRIVAAHAGVVLAAGRHFDDQIGWVGDLTPYYDRLDAKQLWTTLPIVVIVDDGNGYRSVYAHFSKVVVKTGQTVRAGQLLGYEGRTGHASGCHLHYGLFSPLESATFAIDPAVAKRMKLPAVEVARVDPLVVLPPRPDPAKRPPAGASGSPPAPKS
jgi:murein DD-endopeptidase MepM/ murein hydrolase activator NlpD